MENHRSFWVLQLCKKVFAVDAVAKYLQNSAEYSRQGRLHLELILITIWNYYASQ